jgi:ubiquinone/menaquinone biosynthesis C-methylase UbiE
MRCGRLFAALYDRGARHIEEAGLRSRRHSLLAGLDRDVLEVGAGTGLNLAHYSPAARLVLLEPDPHMQRKLEERVHALGHPAEIVAGVAEELPFADESFDAVVATLVLCSVMDLDRALSEIRRVLRPGGRLLLIEHVRGQGGRARVQDIIAPLSRALFSCSPNRRTADAVRAAGFELSEEAFELRGSAPWRRPAIQGIASKPAAVHW